MEKDGINNFQLEREYEVVEQLSKVFCFIIYDGFELV